MGVRLYGDGFSNEFAAKLAGERALRELLDNLANEPEDIGPQQPAVPSCEKCGGIDRAHAGCAWPRNAARASALPLHALRAGHQTEGTPILDQSRYWSRVPSDVASSY
jgi:hypothetical protein